MSTKTKNLFFPIADATQVRFKIDFFFNSVRGSEERYVPLIGNLKLPVNLTAVSFFTNKEGTQSGVLFKSAGELYLLFAFNKEHAVTSVFVIKQSSLGKSTKEMEKLVPEKATIKEAYQIVEKGVKNSFYQKSGQTAWIEFNVGG